MDLPASWQRSINHSMAAITSHQDASRKGVGATAHGVATLRGLEKLQKENAMFHDPYADLLGGEVGAAFVQSFESKPEYAPYGLIDGIAVRTNKIDSEISCAINLDNFDQICVLGAGLDTRPWRLTKDVERSVHYFEVDFQELFDFKLPILNNAGATSTFEYHNVVADLSLPIWPEVLIKSGFDATKRTLWQLEGLIGYLTEDEANALFRTISGTLSAQGSRVVATFLTPATKARTHMHRFFPENPLAFVNGHGWVGEQEEIEKLGERYNRPIRDRCMEGYYIVVANLVY